MPPLDPTTITLLVGALGVLIVNVTLGVKNLAEAKKIRKDAGTAATQLDRNGGSTTADAVARTETRVIELARSVGGMRDDLRQVRDEKTNDHVDIRRRLDHLEQKVYPSASSPRSPS